MGDVGLLLDLINGESFDFVTVLIFFISAYTDDENSTRAD